MEDFDFGLGEERMIDHAPRRRRRFKLGRSYSRSGFDLHKPATWRGTPFERFVLPSVTFLSNVAGVVMVIAIVSWMLD